MNISHYKRTYTQTFQRGLASVGLAHARPNNAWGKYALQAHGEEVLQA